MKELASSFFTKYFGILAVLLNILNVCDTFLTIHWVTNDIAEEANPLMDYLIVISPWLFASIKIILVALGSWLLYRFRESRVSWLAMTHCLIVYLWLMSVHYQVYADNLAFLAHIG